MWTVLLCTFLAGEPMPNNLLLDPAPQLNNLLISDPLPESNDEPPKLKEPPGRPVGDGWQWDIRGEYWYRVIRVSEYQPTYSRQARYRGPRYAASGGSC